jgi:hypothetical protein
MMQVVVPTHTSFCPQAALLAADRQSHWKFSLNDHVPCQLEKEQPYKVTMSIYSRVNTTLDQTL